MANDVGEAMDTPGIAPAGGRYRAYIEYTKTVGSTDYLVTNSQFFEFYV